MVLVLRKLYDGYQHYVVDYKDPRNHDFLLVRSPVSALMILGAYLLFVQRIGPQFMVHRKPYQLRSILLTYNFLQVIFNFYTATAGFYHSYWQPDFDYAGYNHYNGTITTTTSFALANICYFYFWTKVFDLFDTVFFVLRKKSNQISFLHIYHHCTMIFVEYIHNKYFAGSHYMFLLIINSFIHTIMYSYYFLTILRPNLQKSLWWKKHITELQMVQFSALILHFGWPMFSKNFRSLPKAWCMFAVVQNLFMLILFADFYGKAYLREKTPEMTHKKEDNNNVIKK